ncbi:hypothetical protein Pan97_13940 [Bremerella volcania]|uniref:Uncharacterized protein n=1 Tax=Bremerella volcania TaxID=2527984 RepID=A0A518C584_9BACT|nr:hypothetical protein Pan97_13940 [Bremerella volcania]
MSDLLAIIFAPLIAFFEALLGLVIAVATLIAEIANFFLELLITALFKGITSARERYRQGPRKASEVPGPVVTAILTVGFLVVVAVGFTFLIRNGIQHSRTARTQDQVDALADAYIAQLEKDDGRILVPGPSDQHDAWDNAIVLQENDYIVGTQVVVRSNGPDGRPNSADDISAVRYHKTTAKEIRDQFVDKAVSEFGRFFNKQEEVEDQAKVEEPIKNGPADATATSDENDSTSEDEKKEGWKLPSLKFGWDKKEE